MFSIKEQIQEPCHIILLSRELHLKGLMIIKCYRFSGSTYECLLPANTYCRIALILRCDRIPGFVSSNINNIVSLDIDNIAINNKLQKS